MWNDSSEIVELLRTFTTDTVNGCRVLFYVLVSIKKAAFVVGFSIVLILYFLR